METNLLSLSEGELARCEEILASIVDCTRGKDLWSDFGLKSDYNLHVETRWKGRLRGNDHFQEMWQVSRRDENVISMRVTYRLR
jgi:hypothetical protein